ncbi:MAG: hypothetical protein R3E50_10930 [Halioglobus sp.]
MVSMALLVVAVVLASVGLQYRSWAMTCLVPLTFAGLALMHARVVSRGQGAGWLTGFYLAWVIFDPVKLLVVGFAVADSWVKFRQRWSAGPGTAVVRRDEPDRKDDSEE